MLQFLGWHRISWIFLPPFLIAKNIGTHHIIRLKDADMAIKFTGEVTKLALVYNFGFMDCHYIALSSLLLQRTGGRLGTAWFLFVFELRHTDPI